MAGHTTARHNLAHERGDVMNSSRGEAMQLVRLRVRLYRQAGCSHEEAVRRAIANTDGSSR
jgi:hypothetical protein